MHLRCLTQINPDEVRLENSPTYHRRVFFILCTHCSLCPNPAVRHEPDGESRFPENLREVSR